MPKHPAPKVYIDDILMDAFKADKMPVLGGMSIEYGVDTDLDMQGVEQCSLSILIKEPSDPSFLDLGKTLAIYHQPTAGESSFTYFVGRIQRLNASHVIHAETKEWMLQVDIQASDFTADLVNETVYNVASIAVPASTRIGHMNFWAPDGWTVNSFPLRFPDRVHAVLSYKEKPFLELLDQFLRGQIMQRTNRSYYVPGTGAVKVLTAIQDSTKSVARDKLGKYADGRWGVNAGLPTATSTVSITVHASNILADAGWTKEPEDVITEVSLQRLDPWNGEDDSKRTPITSRNHVDTAAMRTRFGIRSVEFDTDLPAGGDVSEVVPVFNHWLSTESQWRTKSLTFKDTERLTISQLSYLIAPTSRQTAFLVVRDPVENRPDRGTSDIRGVVIGGSATWTGKKWELSVTLGRVPGLPADGNYYTCANIATEAEGYFAAGQCDTVGDELSCNDFLRIGAPA
ncbi:hypothetical protein [Paenarthrobacter ilicis]|uniref:hypothetical protein n=1 Tax=Paenarthrobacter ilicis TaxID=43665 RepID=UPI00386A42CA